MELWSSRAARRTASGESGEGGERGQGGGAVPRAVPRAAVVLGTTRGKLLQGGYNGRNTPPVQSRSLDRLQRRGLFGNI